MQVQPQHTVLMVYKNHYSTLSGAENQLNQTINGAKYFRKLHLHMFFFFKTAEYFYSECLRTVTGQEILRQTDT